MRLVRRSGSTRPASRARAFGVTAACVLAIGSVGCTVDEGSREAQALTPLAVRLTDPIPTYQDGSLAVSVGEGVWVTFDVSPADHLELVELRASDPDALLGRLGHGPFKFYLAKSVIIGGAPRQLCALASDAAGTHGDACFWAVP
jgi:hypothetical protein